MDIVKDLRSALKSAEPLIYDILTKDFREELNKNIHVLDLSYDTLLSSTYSRLKGKLSENEQAAYSAAYSTLVSVLLNKCAGRVVSDISDPLVKTLVDKKFATGPILIHSGNNNYLIGSQFSSLQTYYSKNIAGDPSLRSSRFGKSTIYKQKVDKAGRAIPDDYSKESRIKTDFGHIPTAGDENLTSPLVKKIENVLNSSTNPVIQSNAQAAINELYTIQAKITHRFKNTTPEAIDTSRKILGQGYVVVTLQNKALNAKFSTEEARVYSKLLRSIVNKIDYTSIKGSNSIRQDIVEGILNILSGNKKRLKPHRESKAESKVEIKSKAKAKASSGSGFLTVSTPTRTPLINLEAILRARINKQVMDNMGQGSDTRVLNYRSGRFSSSVEIDRLSESRQGLISVFYKYMKNPYATFSEGGRQEFPRTRDPKALISKSIREIAAPIVGNRLRAIVV
jgi:hypothetical protein